MTIQRRLFLAAGILAILSTLVAGCTTRAIEARHFYTENVSTILISQDQKKIVFIGKSYHYIFDAPAGIVATLNHPLHGKVSGNLTGFHVDAQQVVTGDYSLIVSGELAATDKADALAAGYQPDAGGQLTLSGKLHGTRYQQDTSLVGTIDALRNPQTQIDEKSGTPQNLNKTYSIVIAYDPSTGEKAADKLITPVVVTSDGLYLLFNLVLAPVLIPMAVTKVSPDCVPYCMSTFK